MNSSVDASPAVAALKPQARIRALLSAARHYDPLFRNAHVLTLSSLLTSAFGAVYWILAARLFSPAVIGRNYAAVSAMMFLGGLGQLNLANVMIRFVPSASRRTGRLVGLAYVAAAVTTLLLAAGLVVLIPRVSPGLDFLRAPVLGACFIVATAGYAIFNLQDAVLTGLRRTDWVALENGLFSVEKIVLLAVFAGLGTASGIIGSWMIGLALSIVLTNAFIFGRAIPRHEQRPPETRADPSRPTARYLAADYAGALCWLAAVTLPPVIVLNRLGAADSAYFSVAWLVVFTLYSFSSNMGYSLIVESAHDLTRLRHYRRVLWHAGWVLAAAVAVLLAAAPWVLRLFGSAYAAHGTVALELLALSALPNLLTATVVAVSRVRRRMTVVVGVLATLSALVLTLTELLLPVMGLTGAAAAWLIAQCVLAGCLLWRRSWWLPDAAAAEPAGSSASRSGPHLRALPAVRSVLPLMSPFPHWPPDRITARRLARRTLPGTEPEVRSARRTPGGLLVVRLVRGAVPDVAVKHPLTERAARTLAREREVLSRLADDEHVAQWRRLLPPSVVYRPGGPFALVAETWLPGVDASTLIRLRPEAAQRVAAVSLAAIGELHRATGHPESATGHIGPWVDRPAAVLAQEVPWCRTGEGAALLRILRRRLREGLTGSTIDIAWTHGDFCAGNILLSEDCTQVTGVIDWGGARPDGPAEIDAYTLLLTLRHELTGRQLGRVVADAVRGGGLAPTDRRLLADAGMSPPGGRDEAVLPLLAWLWHVAGNVSKSRRYGRSHWWVAGNVAPVLKEAARWQSSPR